MLSDYAIANVYIADRGMPQTAFYWSWTSDLIGYLIFCIYSAYIYQLDSYDKKPLNFFSGTKFTSTKLKKNLQFYEIFEHVFIAKKNYSFYARTNS